MNESHYLEMRYPGEIESIKKQAVAEAMDKVKIQPEGFIRCADCDQCYTRNCGSYQPMFCNLGKQIVTISDGCTLGWERGTEPKIDEANKVELSIKDFDKLLNGEELETANGIVLTFKEGEKG